MRSMWSMLLHLDMNLIITAHEKDRWAGNMCIGKTYDCYTKTNYMLDLILNAQLIAGQRLALVEKSRVESFPVGHKIPMDFDVISRIYGQSSFVAPATAVQMASDEQVARLVALIEAVRVPDETTFKWLEKAGVEDWSEMTCAVIDKCIEFLEDKTK